MEYSEYEAEDNGQNEPISGPVAVRDVASGKVRRRAQPIKDATAVGLDASVQHITPVMP